MRQLFFLAAVAAAAVWLAPGSGGAARPEPIRVLVPAYFYPGGAGLAEWDRMIAEAKRVPIVAIANPGSGPGERQDPNYVQVLRRARAGGVKLIGYVSTHYTEVPETKVRADIETWLRLYPEIQGFFLDEQSSGAEKLPHYASISRFAREKLKDALIVTNPGVPCAEAYLSRKVADAACIFEHFMGFDEFQPPGWFGKHPRSRFAVLPYKVADAGGMRDYLRKAVARNAGWFYCTDRDLPNPWDRLPSYWREEVDAVRQVNKEAP
jgi:hypothetical protein